MTTPRQHQPFRRTRSLAVVGATTAVTLLIAVAVACGGKASPTATPSPSPVPVPSYSPSPTATATPQPTATPLPTATPTPTATPSPTPTPSDAQFAQAKAAAYIISEFNVPSSKVTVVSIQPKAWPDTSLGCPQPGMAYAQHVVPGWVVEIGYNGNTYEFHTDALGDQMVTCDPALVGTPLPTLNLVQSAQLQDVTSVVIASASNPDATSSQIVISDSAKVAALVQALDGVTSLQPEVTCSPMYVITFKMTNNVVTFEYGCSGNGTLIRGDEPYFHGDDGIVPATFSQLVGQTLASRPFPGTPGQ